MGQNGFGARGRNPPKADVDRAPKPLVGGSLLVLLTKPTVQTETGASAAVRLPLSRRGRRAKAETPKEMRRLSEQRASEGVLQKPQAPAFAGDADPGGVRKSKAKTQAAGQREQGEGAMCRSPATVSYARRRRIRTMIGRIVGGAEPISLASGASSQ